MELEAITVVGPTACGKTRRAVQLARAFDGEIISGDSRQVYRGMDIGTGKDLADYGEIPYHLIDIAEPGTKYNLHRYLKDFNRAFDTIRSKGKMPIICGGTGMYIENALNGINMPEVPENPALRESLRGHTLSELEKILASYKTLHNVNDTDTCQRAIRAIEIQEYYHSHPGEALTTDKSQTRHINSLIIGLDIPRETRRQRISERLKSRLEDGMVDEVRGLIGRGVEAENLMYYGLEYKFVTQFVIGQIDYNQMVSGLEIAIHQFAKRQMTWFRGMERRGFHIYWLPYDLEDSEFIARVSEFLNER